MPSPEYLRLLDARGADLHGRGHVAGHPDNVATVWSVSLDRLQATAPAAVQLLELCAWLSAEPVPVDLLTGHPGLLPEPLATAAADPVAFNVRWAPWRTIACPAGRGDRGRAPAHPGHHPPPRRRALRSAERPSTWTRSLPCCRLTCLATSRAPRKTGPVAGVAA